MKKYGVLLSLLLVAAGAFGQFPATSPAERLLEHAIDIHIHSAPDIFGRAVNDFEAAMLAKRYGFDAIVIKNHVSGTAARAALVNLIEEDITVFGGIVLNKAVGGLNPVAVLNMALMSREFGKMVWFPTFDSEGHKRAFGDMEEGITILEGDRLKPAVDEILDIIREYDLVLLTGHLAKEEVFELVREAHRKGIRKIVVTHALADSPGLSIEDMQELASYGVYFELTYLGYLSGPQSHLGFLQKNKHISVEAMSTAIRRVGAERFIMSSDLGQSGNPIPPDGMKHFVEIMLNAGVSETDVLKMIRYNPHWLLFGE